jgi:hypothetical protein
VRGAAARRTRRRGTGGTYTVQPEEVIARARDRIGVQVIDGGQIGYH